MTTTTTLQDLGSPGESSTKAFLDRNGICKHAVANGSQVIGISAEQNWTWETSLAPHQVHSVACNDDGSVVVAATDGGTVSLIRNGKVVLTRPVDASLSWIDNDTLLLELTSQQLILIPVSDYLSSAGSGSSSGPQMQLLSLPPDSSSASFSDFRGWRQSSSNLRFFACDEHSQLVVFDCEQGTNTLKHAQSSSPPQQQQRILEDGWTLHPGIALHIQKVAGKEYLVCGCVQNDRTAVVWCDPISLRPVCRYELPSARSKLLALEPLTSLPETACVAVAEKVLSSKGKTRIYTVQVVVEETMGLALLTKPHVLYTVPLENSLSITISALPTAFAFRFKIWKSVHECMYQVFLPHESTSRLLSDFRRCLAQNTYDGADRCLQQSAAHLENTIRDAFANFHPSEIALGRLRAWLQHGDMSTADQAQGYLKQIATGAVSGNAKGRSVLLKAVQTVVQTSANRSLVDLTFGLSAMSACLNQVITALPETDRQSLIRMHEPLQEQLAALQTLKRIGAQVPRTCGLHKLKSPAHLYEVLIHEGQWNAAERLGRSSSLALEELVGPVLKIQSQHCPKDYVPLLRDLILPRLPEDLLARLRAWTCRTADALDETDQPHRNLDAAVLLLQTMDKETRELRVKSHASFATFTPFVERLETRKRISPRNNISTSSSESSTNNSMTTLATTNSSPSSRKRKERSGDDMLYARTRPAPTLLELGALRGGAGKSRTRMTTLDDNADDEDCVESKLRAALCLQQARKMGLTRKAATLGAFSTQGGASTVAKALVRLISASAKDHEERWAFFCDRVKPFCSEFAVSYDDVLLACTSDLCRAKIISKRAIQESASIARCCSSVIAKCRAALSVIRAALRCGDSPDWLADLSKEAILWASCDSGLQSELEEATRLLLIDCIVVRYCGSGAKEIFRVDNPRHAIRLLEFVSKHVDHPSVVADALALCDAFHHLSAPEAGSSILCNALLRGDSDLLVSLLVQLFEKSTQMAQASVIGSITYAEELLEERQVETSRARTLHPFVAQLTIEMLTSAMEYGKIVDAHAGAELGCYLHNGSLEKLRNDFMRIMRLERDHGVYASLSKLASPGFLVSQTSLLLREAVGSSSPDNLLVLGTRITAAKKACALLAGEKDADVVWSIATSSVVGSLVPKHQGEYILKLLEIVGLLDSSENATYGQVAVAIAFFRAASVEGDSDPSLGSQQIGIAASLLRDWALTFAPERLASALVAVSSNLDLVCQILTRSDEGKGEKLDRDIQALQVKAWQTKMATPPPARSSCSVTRLSCPTLHPSWYIGDGLLLPPQLALNQSLNFSKAILHALSGEDNITAQLFEFISERGAHFLALRVLSSWSCVHMCRGVSSDSLDVTALRNGFEGTKLSLAERSLGGSGSGITNAVVDSELAVSFLLALPIKKAFKTYKACLPTAVKTRNYQRLLCLANVGIVSSGGSDNAKNIGWNGQDRFLLQCKKLASRARWSIVLHQHGIAFDPQRFGEDKASGVSSTQPCQYAGSLVPSVIAALSKTMSPSEVISLTSLFAEEFGLHRDLVVQKHVEFLLAPGSGNGSSNGRTKSIRHCEGLARSSLRLLHSASVRFSVLRRCLLALESNPDSGVNYEHFGLVLLLYQEALSTVLDLKGTSKDHGTAQYQLELELVHRRRDALTILSSFFQGDKRAHRPPLSVFFLPLGAVSTSGAAKPPFCGVLGKGQSQSFDPIAALESTLRTFPDSATATSLAPLCFPLGLPSGFIHARSLIVRFTDATADSSAYPSFDNDIVPVCERLRSPSDRATLAEWCACQYKDNDVEKLKCLDFALKSAVLASTEIERRRQLDSTNEKLEALEQEFLECVKRITATKEALSDRLRVKTILRASKNSSQGSIDLVIETLIEALNEESAELSPEALITFLLEEGSLVAAKSCLASQTGFSIAQLRKFSSAVHQACTAVAEQHSHIHPYHYAKRFARKWLLHGDEVSDCALGQVDQSQPNVANEVLTKEVANCDDTMEFVMDLADIQADDEWGAGVGGSQNSWGAENHLTSEEEPSAIESSSLREVSERASQQVALRICFVLAYHDPSSEGNRPNGKENGLVGLQPRPSLRKRTGLLGKIDTKRDTRHEDRIRDLCKELLGIVFAGAEAGPTSSLIKIPNSLGMDDGEKLGSSTAPRTITFAMRHRALRAASILCPQEALEQVIKSEGHLVSGSSGKSSSLRQCSFGAFVAKEIEEMGLPLPHDDLGRLSSMHFLSYARTLWRHHRANDNKRSKGRLILLLIEMSLKEVDTDVEFVETLFQEAARLRLPRTLLLALESVCDFLHRGGNRALLQEVSIQSAVDNIIECVSSQSKELASNVFSDEAVSHVLATVDRLYRVVAGLTLASGDKMNFMERFLDFGSRMLHHTKECRDLSSALSEITSHAKRLSMANVVDG